MAQVSLKSCTHNKMAVTSFFFVLSAHINRISQWHIQITSRSATPVLVLLGCKTIPVPVLQTWIASLSPRLVHRTKWLGDTKIRHKKNKSALNGVQILEIVNRNLAVIASHFVFALRFHYSRLLNVHFSSNINTYWSLKGMRPMQMRTVSDDSATGEALVPERHICPI